MEDTTEKTEEKKTGLFDLTADERKVFFKTVKKVPFWGAALAIVFIYGPQRIAEWTKERLAELSEKAGNAGRNFLAWLWNAGPETGEVIKEFINYIWSHKKLRRWFVLRSFLVIIMFFEAVVVGVHNHWGWFIGVFTILTVAHFASLYFLVKSVVIAAGKTFNFGKDTVKVLSKLPKAVLEKAGLEFKGEEATLKKESVAKKLKVLLNFPLVFAAFGAWLALLPYWRTLAFASVFGVVALSILLATRIRDVPTQFWKYYTKITIIAGLLATLCFLSGLAFERIFPETYKTLVGQYRESIDKKWNRGLLDTDEKKVARVTEQASNMQAHSAPSATNEPSVNNEPDYEDGDEESHLDPNELVQNTVGANIPTVAPRADNGSRRPPSVGNSDVGDGFWYDVADIIREEEARHAQE